MDYLNRVSLLYALLCLELDARARTKPVLVAGRSSRVVRALNFAPCAAQLVYVVERRCATERCAFFYLCYVNATAWPLCKAAALC